MLLPFFLVTATVLWVSIFGYVALLFVAMLRRRFAAQLDATSAGLPSVAVVVPVRNEEELLPRKIANLQECSYGAGRLSVLLVDGGSTDGSAELAEAACARLPDFRLLRVPGARGRADQLNAALQELEADIVVVSDADAELAPDCVRELVGQLRREPDCEVLGARVRPATRLLEERIHWWLLNSLWWLEGEALGNGQVSGVCYAIRRRATTPLPPETSADDIFFGLCTSARGRAVRLCRSARATELRVPQTLREFLSFRRRRGGGYLRELRRARPSGAPARWHAVQAIRLFHFFAMPLLAATVAATGLALLATADWRWPLAAATAFVAPGMAALLASSTLGAERPRWQLGLAAGRMAGLTWFSLLDLHRAVSGPFGNGD